MSRGKTAIMILTTIGVLAAPVCARFLPYPFIWISLAWVVIFVSLARWGKSNSLRLVSTYLGAAVLACGLAEGYLWWKVRATSLEMTRLNQPQYTLPHTALGFAPAPRNRTRSVKRAGNTILYDVHYTIDSTGLRVAPPSAQTSHEAILFFGCSFTYGEGVHDTETTAYRTGIKTGGRFHVYNFGFSGYGPHQILARLQGGSVDSVVRSTPKYAVYQAITGQVPRVAGLTFWNRHDPRYVRGAHGGLELAGHFDDGPRWWLKLQLFLDKCLILRTLRSQSVGRQDISLFVDIVDSCRTIFERTYPGAEFHVIYWASASDGIGWEIIDGLRKRGVRIHTGDMVLSDQREKYMLSKYDGHPNALAHTAIADYVVEKIVR